MLGFFPTPLPDELWYSVCARFGKIVRYSKERLSFELWGKKNARLTIDLPCYLDQIVAKLPFGHSITPDRIIRDFTLFPFYSPFLNAKTANRIVSIMKNQNARSIHLIARISNSPIPIPQHLKYCPVCYGEDEKGFGVSYWHRLHQVPGVTVCPDHEVFLENSNAKVVFQKNKIELFCAADYVSKVSARKINKASDLDRSHLLIAKDVKRLLTQKGFQPKSNFLKTIYYELFEKHGFYNPKNGIKAQKLIEHLNEFYPVEFLRELQSECQATDPNNWVYKLSTYFRIVDRLIPIRHLLLMRALDQSPETFFSESSRSSSVKSIPEREFIAGPYPCLNPVCAAFMQLSIESHEIQSDFNSKENFIVITCNCGFKYRRRGKDSVPEDIFRRTSVVEYGKVWEKELKQLWDDEDKSIRQISNALKVKTDTVKWMAAKTGQKFPRKIKGGITVGLTPANQKRLDKELNKEKIKQQQFIQVRKSKREDWLRIRKLNPEANITQFRLKIAPPLVQWLYTKDRGWFDEHKPRKKQPNRNVDWSKRDILGVEIVKKAVETLKEGKGRPEWITKYSISRHFEKPNWIVTEKFSKKMPKTMNLLNELIENRLEYNLRKIRWAIEELKKEFGSPMPYLIAEKAHVHPNFREEPQIKGALESGSKEISETILYTQS